MKTLTNRHRMLSNRLALALIMAGGTGQLATAQQWLPLGPDDGDWASREGNRFSMQLDAINAPVVAYRDDAYSAKLTVMRWNGSAWVTIGAPGITPGGMDNPDLALDASGNPVVAYRDYANGSKTTVMRWNGSTWSSVGPPGISVGYADEQSLELDSSGNPVVAYRDGANGLKVTVMRWNGSSWNAVGSAGMSSGSAEWPSLQLASNGDPTVAYCDGANGNKTTVVRWNGSAWSTVGGPGISAGAAYYQSLALDASGNPVVAYSDQVNGQKTSVLRWDGSTWSYVGSSGISMGGTESQSLALDASDNPVVAYIDVPNGRARTVMRWDGVNWNPVGPLGFTQVGSSSNDPNSLSIDTGGNPVLCYLDYSKGLIEIQKWSASSWASNYHPVSISASAASGASLTLDVNGAPVVAYVDCAAGNKASVMRWNGNSWTSVGSPGISAGIAYFQSLALDGSGNPVVAYRDDSNGSKTTVMRWDGNGWSAVGSPGFSAGIAQSQSLALDGSGYPVVAYQDQANGSKTTVMRWNGSTWSAVGSPGISTGGAVFQSLALDGSGNPVVAYRDDANGSKTTVIRWNGSSWISVGTPGFSAGGSNFQSMVLNVGGNPIVAYQDNSNGNKVTVMQWNGSAWNTVGIPGFSTDATDWLSLTLDVTGNPVVAYRKQNNGRKTEVMRWTGSSWVVAGTGGFKASTSHLGSPCIRAKSNGDLILAECCGSLYVKQLENISIATGAISGSPLCGGSPVNVPYSAGGSFDPGNTFTAQISDASGSFASPVSIGSVSSTTSGSIACTIPPGTPSGTGYRIRVISSSPAVTGSDNGSNLVIGSFVNAWAVKAAFGGTARNAATSFSIGSKGYVACGHDGTNFKADLWEYDPASNSWAQKADMPGAARSYASSFSIGSKGYVCLGLTDFSGTNASDLWAYDPTTNTWAARAAFPGGARNEAVSFSIGGMGYVGLGAAASLYADFYAYDPVADAWTAKASFPGGARAGVAGFAIGSLGYIGLGGDALGNYPVDLYAYDPTSNAWSPRASFPGTGRRELVSFTINSSGYVCTGLNGSTYFDDLWKYDPTANSWLQRATFNGSARKLASAFSIGSRAYLGLGSLPPTGALADFWQYTPDAGITTGTLAGSSFCPGAVLNVPYTAVGAFDECASNTFTAQLSDAGGSFASPVSIGSVNSTTSGNISCTIPNGTPSGTGYRIRVISSSPAITGSDNGSNIGINLSITTGWTQRAALGSTGRSGAFAFSIGSIGYMGTGQDGSTYRRDFWAYDPSTGVWTQKADFGGTGRYGAAAFSLNGKGYAGCGDDGSPNFLNDFWEYDPVANTWAARAGVPGPSTGRLGAVGFSIGSKGYFATGSVTTDLLEYDPATNAWSWKAPLPGPGRYSAVGFSIGSTGYVGTGAQGGTILDDFYAYDPATNTWSAKATVGGGVRVYAAGFSIGSKGYIAGGASSGGNAPGLVDVRVYDPASNTWTAAASLPGSGKRYSAAFSLNGKGYFGTGLDNASYYNDFWEFNPPNEITTTVLSTSTCAGSALSVPYTAAGTFGGCSPNTFTAQLSDASGSFASPVAIGNVVSNVSGTIACTIPPGTPSGTGYRIRVISSNPAVTGSDNGSNIGIGAQVVNAWVQRANLGGAGRSAAVAFSVNGKGYVTTGANNGTYYADLWAYDPATNSWSQKADFGGGPRDAAVGFGIGNLGYVGTGRNGGTRYQDLWAYDPAANTWTQKANFPGTARQSAVGFSIGTKGYIGTGNAAAFTTDFYEYDPATDAWTQKASLPAAGRYDATGFAIGTKGYLGTGDTPGGLVNDFWQFDPATNSWTAIAPLAGFGRYVATTFSLGGQGYVGMGLSAPSSGYLNDLWMYQPASNTWTQVASLPSAARSSSRAFAIGTTGYLGLGYDGSTARNDLWAYLTAPDITTSVAVTTGCAGSGLSVSYTATGMFGACATNTFTAQLSNANGSFASPVDIGSVVSNVSGTIACTIPSGTPNGTGYRIRVISSNPAVTGSDNGSNISIGGALPPGNTWTAKATFGSGPRQGAFSFALGGKVYMGTGYCCGSPMNDFWAYDPTTNAWTQRANVPGPARAGGVGFSIGSLGYAGTGGHGSYSADFYSYDPATNAWTQRANVPGPVRGAGVGFSIGGTGYVGTGENASSTSLYSDLWAYSPATDTWVQKASMGAGRKDAVAFTIGNKAYIGTGSGSGGHLGDFWEYDPATDAWTAKAAFGGGPREQACGFSCAGLGYLGTGYNGSILTDLWEYDPTANSWVQRPSLPGSSRYKPIAAAVNGVGYVGFGTSGGGNWPNEFFAYSPGSRLNTDALSSSAFCAGTALSVPYSFANINYAACNTFTAQLSDGAGNFTSPVAIGSVVSSASGSIPCTIPANTPFGTAYRIRVISNSPAVTGTDNGSDITIGTTAPLVLITPGGSTAGCAAGAVTLNAYPGLGYTYLWSNGATTQSITPATSGNYSYTATSYGCTATSAPSPVSISQTAVLLSDDFSSAALGSGGAWTRSFLGTYGGDYPYNWFSVQNGGAAISGNTMEIINVISSSSATFGYGTQSVANANFIPIIYREVNATGRHSLKISYDWLCQGEPWGDGGILIIYDPALGYWYTYGNPLNYQSSVQHVTDLALPANLANRTFYIGWEFFSNQAVVNNPGLSLDNIVLTGADYVLGPGDVPTGLCTGMTIQVPYDGCGYFPAGNTITAQLSDASGSFAPPVSIGSVVSSAAGTIAATIPPGTAPGTGYRIRVVSSDPVVTGIANAQPITINTTPTADAGSYPPMCSIDPPVALVGTPGGGDWLGNGVLSGAQYTFTPQFGTQTLSYVLAANGCSDTATTVINVTQATTWYSDLGDGDGLGDPAVDSVACAQPASYVASNTDACPLTPGTIGTACDDGDANTINDAINASCICAGTLYGARVAVRVMLDGPYNTTTGLMDDGMRSLGLVPTLEPYTGLGYPHVSGGGESTTAPVLALAGNDAIVDWVVLELRDANTPSTVVATQCALLQRDGDVVATDGTSPLNFNLPSGNYGVVVRHRNHLGCMTAVALALSPTTTPVDFTSAATGTYGTSARKTSGGAVSVQVLWSGDVTFNHQIKYTGSGNDRDPILVTVGSTTPNNVVSGYSTRDVNLNGEVKYTGSGNDRDRILVNVGSTTPNNIRVEQLP